MNDALELDRINGERRRAGRPAMTRAELELAKSAGHDPVTWAPETVAPAAPPDPEPATPAAPAEEGTTNDA